MNESNNQPLLFKECLDKSTNLITIFGVFNALTVYASGIDDRGVSLFLFPTCFVLSILVWFEMIQFAMESSDGSPKYTVLYFLYCFIEFGLVYYFISKFYSLIEYLCVLGIFMVIAWGYKLLMKPFFKKWFKGLFVGKRKEAPLVLVFTSAFLALITLIIIKLVIEYLKKKI